MIEVKILNKSMQKTMDEGLAQTKAYMDLSAADEGHLVIFDRSSRKSWEKKIFRKVQRLQEVQIAVWGM